jgi:hypothetical protein
MYTVESAGIKQLPPHRSSTVGSRCHAVPRDHSAGTTGRMRGTQPESKEASFRHEYASHKNMNVLERRPAPVKTTGYSRAAKNVCSCNDHWIVKNINLVCLAN